jgi:O-antigen/teichoic acid export membrane protein
VSCSPENEAEFRLAMVVCSAGFALSLPSRVGGVICNAHGRLVLPAISDIVAQLASFSLLFLIVWVKWQSLLALVICMMISTIVCPMGLTWLALRRHGYALAGGEPPSSEDKGAILSKGLYFFMTFIGEILIVQSDAVMVSSIKGPLIVPLLIIPLGLWINFLQAQNAFLRPLWPILAAQHAAGQLDKLRATIKKTLLLSAGAGLGAAFAIAVLGDWFIRLWSKGLTGLPPVMAMGLGVYVAVSSLDNALAAILNALGKIELRFCYTFVFGVAKVFLGILVLKFVSYEWVPAAYAVAMLATSLPFAIPAVVRVCQLPPACGGLAVKVAS